MSIVTRPPFLKPARYAWSDGEVASKESEDCFKNRYYFLKEKSPFDSPLKTTLYTQMLVSILFNHLSGCGACKANAINILLIAPLFNPVISPG